MPATPGTPAHTGPEDALLRLLPLHLRTRDQQSGGALQALLSAIGGELHQLETDLEELYDGWFAETCGEWALSCLANLVGLTEPLPDLGAGVSRRAVVANTITYRRSKGTVGVLEQVARDVTGWPARAVEYYRLLATTVHANHIRLDRPAAASLRGAARLELTGAAHDLRAERSTPSPELLDLTRGALDPVARTAEVRGIEHGRGRYGIPHIGVFLFPLRAYDVGAARAGGTADAARWAQARITGHSCTVDPLGRSAPLLTAPRSEYGIEHPVQDEDLPMPLRPRRLLALLEAARRGELAAEELPIGVRIGRAGEPLPPERLRVCALEDLAAVAGLQVSVDAVAGRLSSYRDGVLFSPDEVFVRYSYGGLADVGAGTYDRSDVHERVLALDPYDGAAGVAGQVAVRSGAQPSSVVATSVADGLDRVQQAWARPADESAARATYVVAVGDSASYPGDLSVTVPDATRLVLVAASVSQDRPGVGELLTPSNGVYVPEGLRPHVRGSVTVTGGPGSSLVLDGIVLEGDLRVSPGQLAALTVSQCTVSGQVTVHSAPGGTNSALRISLVRSVVGRVDLARPVPVLSITDCILDAALTGAGLALSAPGTHVSLEGSTVRGGVAVRSIDASSCVLDGLVRAEHRQVGCLRYCFVPPGSRVPRRFRCVPGDGVDQATRPVYASVDPGSPVYLALARTCPAAVAEGGEGGADMGVHHHLRRPLRLQAARRHLAAYVPAGLEIGIFGS